MAGRNCHKVTFGNLTPPRCDLVALLLLAALAMAVAQQTPQPVFTELFTYDPTAPSQLLGKWLISSQLDSKLQPLRVGVVDDRIGKTVGRVTVQEGDVLDGASEAMLQASRYVCDSEGSPCTARIGFSTKIASSAAATFIITAIVNTACQFPVIVVSTLPQGTRSAAVPLAV